MSDKPTVVLVHGAWADGSCWSAVIESLQTDGYTVAAPQFPETALKDDVARLRQVLRRQTGPIVLVGHSYGGQIITALGADSAGVTALVYVAAFGLDEGESLGKLLSGGPPTAALAHIIVDEQGFAWIPEEDFVGNFAADVDPIKARVLCAVQQGLSMSTFEDVMGVRSRVEAALRASRPTPSLQTGRSIDRVRPTRAHARLLYSPPVDRRAGRAPAP